jgi:3',5'-cyclic AMP phosphodiesterase CpdA
MLTSFLYSKCEFSYILIFALISSNIISAQDSFRVFPYLQNPGPNAITILWFSEENSPGLLSYWRQDSETKININSNPISAESLTYSIWEDNTYFNGEAPSVPFRHRLRIENLAPATIYEYTVTQGTNSFSSSFRTAPMGNTPIRFIVYGDPETEPESINNFTNWVDPISGNSRPYLIDQTSGYQDNLDVIRSRQPDLVFIAGDLVESGGEQRDWDEFWHRNTDMNSKKSIAGEIPIMAVLGNHEYYEGPYLGQYNQPGSERAVRRFLTYFESPGNNSSNVEQGGRYYSIKYGPATFIVLDVCNNGHNKSSDDTNFYLLGENDQDGGNAPDFSPGSQQYKWLEARLIESQLKSMFTFIILHHAPYSSGPHGYLPGEVENTDNQSGNPVRLLTPVFMQYGVDAVFSGHDEMWERSEISGIEIKPDKNEEIHTINFYDVGIGGDGLREPEEGLDNLYLKFLVHTDVPEVWENNVLKSGGKHYGHLEVDIIPVDNNTWQAILKPVYILPLLDPVNLTYLNYERRTYEDEIILTRLYSDIVVPVEFTSFSAIPDHYGILLSWETQTEKGNYGFEVQRRIESEWQKVTFLEGNGTTTQPNFYEYLDTCAGVLKPGNKVYYRLKQMDINDNFYYSDSVLVEIPNTFSFSQNYPNPFNIETTIEYYLPEPCHIAVKIFNLQGGILRILDDGKKDTGFYKTTWDGKDESGNTVSPGFYFYGIETSSGHSEIKRIVFLK